MTFDFSNKHIVVTGGTGALGSAVVQQLLKAHAHCSIPCYDADELEGVAFRDDVGVYIQTDVDLTDEAATRAFYERAIEANGALWGSVHIAGGFGMGEMDEISKDDFMKQINMNLVTCFNTCKQATARMTDGGRIVNIASRPGLEPRQGAGMIPYSVSKSGVAALTEALAAEVVNRDILVNAIAPSTIDTPANRDSMPDADFEDWPNPAEIAHQIMYLLSEENSVTRGGIIPVYGRS